MEMKKLFLFFLAAAWLATSSGQRITLPEAISLALKNSFSIQIGKNNVDIAGINNYYGIAGGLPLVVLSGSDIEQITSLRQTYANPANNKSSDYASSNTLSAGLNGSELLYNGQRVVTVKKRLGEIESQTKQQLSSRALTVVYNVMLKYYDITRQQSYAKTLQISIDASRQKLEIVKEQQNVGMANNADLFQAQVDLNTQIQNLQAQQLIVDQDKTDLLTLLTLNPDSAITIDDTIYVDKNIKLGNVLEGITTNPDLVAANEQITINHYIEKETAALRYPSLSLSGGYNISRTQNAAGFSLLNENYGPYTGISVIIPLFNGNIYKRQLQIAGINTKNAALQKDTLLLNYTANAIKSWQAYQNNLQQLETAVQTFDLSKKLLDLVIQRFQLHQATIVDVKNAQQSFESAGFALINISYAAKAGEIQLERYANNLRY